MTQLVSIHFHKIMTVTITNTLSLADFFEVDDLYVICTKPPACVLFKPDDSRIPDSGFQGLGGSIMPIFPLKKSISWKGYSIRRQQVPMSPAFCLTQYRVQGLTLEKGVLDMKAEPRRTCHEKCTSNYVLTGRQKTSADVHLLQKIDMSDLLFQPDPRLKLKWIGSKSWKSKPWQHPIQQ